MLHASTRKLIDRLAEMTELGKLDWTEGDGQNVLYSTEGYSVSLTGAPNEVVITSKDGKELERATSEELAATSTEDGKSYATIVAEMTSEAIRVARGTEVAISTLLAGMDDPVVETAPVEEEVSIEEAPEDAVDETSVLSTIAVASVADIATSQDASETDSQSDEAEAVSEVEDESSDADAAAIALVSEVEVEETVTESAETETSETESDVTEAVARMAQEVNERQETTESSSNDAVLAAGAASIGAAAMFAAQGDESTDEAETEAEPATETLATEDATLVSPQPVTEPETEIVVAESSTIEPVSAPEPFISSPEPVSNTYVPFGLETQAAETNEATEATDDGVISIAAAEPELVSEPEPVSEPVSAPELVVEPEVAMTMSEAALTEEASQVETPVETSYVSTDVAPSITPASPEPEAADPVVATAPEPAPAAPAQSYSLSGIGAGFGLGALSAKTEASGIPGPSTSSAEQSDKVVIDATDDVLPQPESHLNVPLAEQATAAVKSAASETPKTEDDESEESDILKPRTRFNPWD